MGSCCSSHKKSLESDTVSHRKESEAEKCLADSSNSHFQKPDRPPSVSPPAPLQQKSVVNEKREDKWILIPLPPETTLGEGEATEPEKTYERNNEASIQKKMPENDIHDEKLNGNTEKFAKADMHPAPKEAENTEDVDKLNVVASDAPPSHHLLRERMDPVKVVSVVGNGKRNSDASSVWSDPGVDAGAEQEEESVEKHTESGATSSIVADRPFFSPAIEPNNSDSDSDSGSQHNNMVNGKKEEEEHKDVSKANEFVEPLVSSIIVTSIVAVTPETPKKADEVSEHSLPVHREKQEEEEQQQLTDEDAIRREENVFAEDEKREDSAPDNANMDKPRSDNKNFSVSEKKEKEVEVVEVGEKKGSSNVLASIILRSAEKERQRSVEGLTGDANSKGGLKARENVVEYDVVFTDDNDDGDDDDDDNGGVGGEGDDGSRLWSGGAEVFRNEKADSTARKGQSKNVVLWSDDDDDDDDYDYNTVEEKRSKLPKEKEEEKYDDNGNSSLYERCEQEKAEGEVAKARKTSLECMDSGSSDDGSERERLAAIFARVPPSQNVTKREVEATISPPIGLVKDNKKEDEEDEKKEVGIVWKDKVDEYEKDPLLRVDEALPPVRPRALPIISPPLATPHNRDTEDDDKGAADLLF